MGHTSARMVVVAAAAATLLAPACSDTPERSAESLCAELEAAQGLDESLAVADADALEEQAAALERAATVAPPEIEAAVALLAQALDEIGTTLGTATGDRRDALGDALAERQDEVDSLTDAGRSVSDWSRVNCGLDLDTGETVPTTTPPATTDDGAPLPAPGAGQTDETTEQTDPPS